MRLFPSATAHAPRAAAEEEFSRAIGDLRRLIRAGKLPPRLPDYNGTLRPEPGELNYWSPVDTGTAAPRRAEQRRLRSRQRALVELGSPHDDVFDCGTGYGDRSTRFVFAGGGSDLVSDTYHQSQVLSGGPGDDVIEADLGNDVVFFASGWGQDVVNFRCGGREVEDLRGGLGWREREGPPALHDTPPHQRARYVVFGRGIEPEELVWADGRHLTHPASGSSVHFDNGICATIVAVEPGSVAPSPEGVPTD